MCQGFTELHQELAELLPIGVHASCVTTAREKGDRLFVSGDESAYLFFVASGEVVLERPGIKASSVVLQRITRGFVGEACLQTVRYLCDGIVLHPSAITQVPIQEVAAAMDKDPAFARRWIGMLNREVRRLRLHCERLSYFRVQDRLLHLLETEGGQFIGDLGLKSLAIELGVTHEALCRTVSVLEKNRLLVRNAGNLELSVGEESPDAPAT